MEYVIQQTEYFAAWLSELCDVKARAAIVRRLERAQAGLLDDVKSVGGGVSETRVDTGAGYRLYYTLRRGVVIILLSGGDKSSQASDIRRARKLAQEY